MPGVEVTVTKSNIIVKCCNYKEALEQTADWLMGAEERLKDDIPWDGLQAVRVLLDEHQVILFPSLLVTVCSSSSVLGFTFYICARNTCMFCNMYL